MGYTCSYMADLYGNDEYTAQALEKRKAAAYWFKKAKNKRSYVCALRDICREYAYIDSLSLALSYLQKADSVGKTLNDPNVYSSILNAYGNIYQMQREYELAEKRISREEFLSIIGNRSKCHLKLLRFSQPIYRNQPTTKSQRNIAKDTSK